jgi:hypothetical protein
MALVETIFLVLLDALPAQESGLDPRPYQPCFRRYCSDCHLEGTAKGGLDLAQVPTDLHDAEALRRWVRIYDRVRLGEMPPPKKEQAPAGERVSARPGPAGRRRCLMGVGELGTRIIDTITLPQYGNESARDTAVCSIVRPNSRFVSHIAIRPGYFDIDHRKRSPAGT